VESWKESLGTEQLNAAFDDVISAHPIHSYLGLPFHYFLLEWIRGSFVHLITTFWMRGCVQCVPFMHHRLHFAFTCSSSVRPLGCRVSSGPATDLPGFQISTGFQPSTANRWTKYFFFKLHGLSPRVNYTDRATAACRRSDCQLLRIEGATWSEWRIPPDVFSVF
jgi:hypothetical protein